MNVEITNDTQLHHRIMLLNNLKEEQEMTIKRNVREVVYSMQPSAIIKNIVNNISNDSEATHDLKTMGLNLGKDFLISKLFGKGQSLKSFLSSLVIRKVTDYIINNHSDLITTGIGKLENMFKDLKTKNAS